MLCKKCGKEIHNNVQCSYCGCENYYERENTPEHLLYIASLLDGLEAEDQGLLQAMGVTANDNVINDDLDEEEEMIRKKYGILINVLTAVACICCLCIGFILGGVVERGQINKENQAESVKMAENEPVNETEKEPAQDVAADAKDSVSDAKGSVADGAVKDAQVTETAIVSPFRVETNEYGETYLLVDLPVGSGNYWYDFSDVFNILNPENMISLASYEQQSLVTVDGEAIKVYTLRLPLEKTEVQLVDSVSANAADEETVSESSLDGADLNEATIPEVNLPTIPDNNQD